MNRMDPETIDYYDCEVVKMIALKYNFSDMDSLKMFVCSKTHEMLEDLDYGLTAFGAGAVFDIWECEKVTGDPRNSVYIRSE
ncbi:MAG: hypothetical protein LIO69_00105 [Oscillospiraceae bacterium]|nr:hypothetical protein [Oscillospiraceae bacterium]